MHARTHMHTLHVAAVSEDVLGLLQCRCQSNTRLMRTSQALPGAQPPAGAMGCMIAPTGCWLEAHFDRR
eukprot:352500-Chlamydomonas_euryale.AAC.6